MKGTTEIEIRWVKFLIIFLLPIPFYFIGVMPRVIIVAYVLLLSVSLSSLCRATSEQFIRAIGNSHESLVPGSAKVSIDDAAFLPIIPVVLKSLKNLTGNIKVPRQKIGGLELGEAEVHNITAGGMSINMEESKRVVVAVWDMSAVVPELNFTYTYWLFQWQTCNGTARTEVSGTNSTLYFNLTIGSDGLVNETIKGVNISIGDLDVTTSMSDCPSMDAIIQLIIAIFKGSIKEQLERIVPERMNPILRNKTEDALTSLPIAFMDDPNITEGRMELSLAILPNASSSRVVPPDDVVPLKQPFPDRDLAVISSFDGANNILRILRNWSLLNMTFPIPPAYNASLIEPIYPDLYKRCSNCFFRVVCQLANDVWVEDDGNGAFTFQMRNGTISMGLYSGNGTSVDALSLSVNTTANVKKFSVFDSTVTLNLSAMSVSLDVEASLIGDFNSTVLNSDIQWVLDVVVVPLVNAQPRGFVLPFNLTGLLFNVSTGAFTMGMNSAVISSLLNIFVGQRWRPVSGE